MKKIVVILIVIFITSCKKKETAPIVTEPICETGNVQFVGKYHLNSYNYDTIEVVFLHNNCPTKNSNTYLVKGLGKAIQPMLKSGEVFEIKDYEIIVNEEVSKGNHGNTFTLDRESSGNLILKCYKIQPSSKGFQKI